MQWNTAIEEDDRDELTGLRGYYDLLNGFGFEGYAGRDSFVVLCGIDDFRFLNDTHGEACGNDVLIQIGAIMCSIFGEDHTFRYGGDEFLIMESFSDEKAFLKKLDALQERIGEIELEDTPLHITCSIGYVYGIITSRNELHEAIRLADRKMYEAKRLGKARALGGAFLRNPSALTGAGGRSKSYKSYESDELTGLANLVHFRAQLERILDNRLIGTDDDPLTLVYFNIENFKGYNERFGFAAGDELLKHVSVAIRDAFDGFPAARYSADQFMVATTKSAAVLGIMSVRSAFRKKLKDSSIWLKAGLYATNPDDHDPGIVGDRAKLACDAIKGRRDVFYREYDWELRHQIMLSRYVLDHFDDALENGWIKIYYQPIMRVATGEVCDEEALARWVDPVEGLLAPNDFIPVLEEARLVHKLDLYMVRRACENYKHLIDDGLPEIPISMNLSRLDFELCDIVSEVEAILEEHGVPRNMLSIEVTESALAGNSEFLKAEIDRFRADGFEVWMDDFGSGYSSLNTLKEYQFDLVKIDMGFLKDFDKDEHARVLLAHIISMAKDLGLKTLVEGVETAQQLEFLKSVGCGRAQGFFLGRPSSLVDSEEAIVSHKYPAIEPREDHEFYELIGRVNLMRPDPVGPMDGHWVAGDAAAAIISRVNGVYEYLNVSDVYRTHLKSMGLKNLKEATNWLNDPHSISHVCMDDIINRFDGVGDWQDGAYGSHGAIAFLHVKLIALDEERDAVAVLSIASEVKAARNR